MWGIGFYVAVSRLRVALQLSLILFGRRSQRQSVHSQHKQAQQNLDCPRGPNSRFPPTLLAHATYSKLGQHRSTFPLPTTTAGFAPYSNGLPSQIENCAYASVWSLKMSFRLLCARSSARRSREGTRPVEAGYFEAHEASHHISRMRRSSAHQRGFGLRLSMVSMRARAYGTVG